jgi:two-component system NarL family response regulator
MGLAAGLERIVATDAATDRLAIMLVDDHYLVRVGLASIIALERDMAICAEASTGEQALALYRAERPDVTLMDLRLPGLSGTEATARIRGEFPEARIIVLSTYAGDEEIHSALQAGAMAYLLKTVQRQELVETIRKVASGQRYIPPEVAARLAERLPRSQLSPRELEVLRLIALGRRNKEIAVSLGLSEGTVKVHVSTILCKLGACDRTEAVTTALQRGIVQLGQTA